MVILVAVVGMSIYGISCYFEGREHKKNTLKSARIAYVLSMYNVVLVAILTGLTVLELWVNLNIAMLPVFMVATGLLYSQYCDLLHKEDAYSAQGGTVPL